MISNVICLLSVTVFASFDRITPSTLHQEGSCLLSPPHFARHYQKQILLQRATIDVENPLEEKKHIRRLQALSSLTLPSSLVNAPQTTPLHQYLVHVKMPITPAVKNLIDDYITPYHLGQYVPHNSFMVVGPNNEDFLSTLASAPSVLHASRYEAPHKIASPLERQATLYSIKSSSSTSSLSSSSLKLLIHLGEEFFSTKDAVQITLTQWEHILAQAGFKVHLDVKLSTLATATVALSNLEPVLAFLAHRNEVTWVEKRVTFENQNKFAKFVIQSNQYNVTDVWQKGLLGEDQVVVIADTGVDFDSCYFDDSTRPAPSSHADREHRKIVLYNNDFGDFIDPVQGHGSHVAGTVLGQARHRNSTTQAIMGEYDGMAPLAKLAFYDLEAAFERDLNVPESLYETIYRDAYSKAGARIASMSWGSDDGSYDSYCRETDRFMWDHPDFLTVFAAGNYGERGHFTISTPGNAKNPISVGACKSSTESFFDLGQQLGFQILSPISLRGSYHVSPANFGIPFRLIAPLKNVSVETAHPPDACSPLLNRDVKGKVILVQRGICLFTIKAHNVRESGAVLMMLVNSDQGPPEVMGGEAEGPDMNFTSVMIAKSLGESMWPYAEKQGFTLMPEDCRIEAPEQFNSEELTENNMAGFSSMGPTKDMRLKPDVVAPGMFIVSVNSDAKPKSYTCSKEESLVSMEGTSMAAPVVAGAVALTREYFIRGFYPSGLPNLKDELTPSGALLKAMMIASATNVGGIVHTQGSPNREVKPAPSPDQGFGRILLDAILFFNQSSAFRLYVTDQDSLPNLGLRSFCFRASPQGGDHRLPPFRATLVWTDPPPSPNAELQMVNDLDLFVTAKSRSSEEPMLFLGNNLSFVDSSGTRLRFWDSNNNVERVSLSAADMRDATIFAVHIRGTHVPEAGGQPFALVVNGNIEPVNVSLCQGTVVCPENCWANASRGKCSELGTCVCKGDFYGSDCGQEVRIIPRDPANPPYWKVQGRSAVLAWDHYYLDVTSEHVSGGWGLEVVMDLASGSKGDPDIYITTDANGAPSLSNFQFSGTSCEPCGQKTSVQINALKVGRYRIGVFGYCCEGADYTLTIRKSAAAQRFYTYLIIGGSVLFLIVCVICGVYLCKKYRRRKAGFRAVQVGDMESLELEPVKREDSVGDEFTDLVYNSDEDGDPKT